MINQDIFNAKRTGLSWNEVGEQFSLTSEAARKRAFRFRLKTGVISKEAISTPINEQGLKMSAQTRPQSALSYREAIEEYLGSKLPDYPSDSQPIAPHRKIVAAGDFHGDPAKQMIAAIINERPDVFIGGGDFYNFHEANPHKLSLNLDPSQTVQAETIRLRAMFDTFAFHLPKTTFYILRGNHDDWVKRKGQELLSPFPYLLQFFTDPYDLLMAGLPPNFIRVVNRWQYEQNGLPVEAFSNTEYLLLSGDVLFSHANFTGANEGDGVRKLKTKFVDRWRGVLSGLDKVKVCVQFHGHKIAHLKPNGGTVHLIEPGMSASPVTMAYQTEYNLKWSPGALGGVVLEQDYINGEWVTDSNSVRLLNPIF